MNKLYPIDYVTYYDSSGKLPSEVRKSMKETKEKGFHILRLTPDKYVVPNEVKAYHAGFKHMREITMPKFMKLKKKNPNIKGFFIAEGDLCIDEDYDFKKFIKDKFKKPIWMGYKKILSDYIVGNFLIYIPATHLEKFNKYFQDQTRLVYSDRFFTRLVKEGKLELSPKSLASEIEHHSKVKRGVRQSEECHIKLKKPSPHDPRD
jgi:hypothetical protein